MYKELERMMVEVENCKFCNAINVGIKKAR